MMDRHWFCIFRAFRCAYSCSRTRRSDSLAAVAFSSLAPCSAASMASSLSRSSFSSAVSTFFAFPDFCKASRELLNEAGFHKPCSV